MLDRRQNPNSRTQSTRPPRSHLCTLPSLASCDSYHSFFYTAMQYSCVLKHVFSLTTVLSFLSFFGKTHVIRPSLNATFSVKPHWTSPFPSGLPEHLSYNKNITFLLLPCITFLLLPCHSRMNTDFTETWATVMSYLPRLSNPHTFLCKIHKGPSAVFGV